MVQKRPLALLHAQHNRINPPSQETTTPLQQQQYKQTTYHLLVVGIEDLLYKWEGIPSQSPLQLNEMSKHPRFILESDRDVIYTFFLLLLCCFSDLKIVDGGQVVYAGHSAEFEGQKQFFVVLASIPEILSHLNKKQTNRQCKYETEVLFMCLSARFLLILL